MFLFLYYFLWSFKHLSNAGKDHSASEGEEKIAIGIHEHTIKFSSFCLYAFVSFGYFHNIDCSGLYFVIKLKQVHFFFLCVASKTYSEFAKISRITFDSLQPISIVCGTQRDCFHHISTPNRKKTKRKRSALMGIHNSISDLFSWVRWPILEKDVFLFLSLFQRHQNFSPHLLLKPFRDLCN